MNEEQETKVRSRSTVWSVALGASLAVAYFYLLLLLGALSSGRDLFSLSFHWLAISLVVAAVLHYFWFRRVAPELGGYRVLRFNRYPRVGRSRSDRNVYDSVSASALPDIGDATGLSS